MQRKSLKTVIFLSIIAGLASAVSARNQRAAGATAACNRRILLARSRRGQGVVESGAALNTTVSGLIREATKDGDVMKVTCLNDKQTQIDGNLRTARQHLVAVAQSNRRWRSRA